MQTNNWLMTGVKFAYSNRKEGKWNKTECREYLATMGIAEKIADNIESKLCFEQDHPSSESNLTDLYPYLWQTNYEPNLFINAPMHQLGHGVLSDIILELHKFLKSKNKATEFKKSINEFITDLIAFPLDWCKLKLYPKDNGSVKIRLGSQDSIFLCNFYDKHRSSCKRYHNSKCIHTSPKVTELIECNDV